MTKQEFIDAIKSNYQYEILNDKEGFQLFIDDIFCDFIITINANETFNITIDIFDENYDMHYGSEKFPAVFVLAYYKSVIAILENEFCTNYELIKSEDYDTNRGFVHSLCFFNIKFDVNLVSRICEILSNVNVMDVLRSDAYDQALLETISNDDDYRENSNIQFEDNKLILKSGYSMIFTGHINKLLPNINFEEFLEADDIYLGLNYTIVKNAILDKMAIIDSKYIKLFKRISDEYEIADIKYYSNFSHLVYVESEKLKFVALMLKINDVAVAKEYELLSKQIYELKKIAPNVPIKMNYDFSYLSSDEFERLCFDLLNSMGFQNVRVIGKTNAPDGGRDIIADEEYLTLFKTERRKWIFQCKHGKKSLDRKEISEIGDLLEEDRAKGYGLFCSNRITPDAINRLENKKEKLNGNVQYYSKAEMTILLEKYSDLAIKYRLLW
jgi:Restriction endonuclease